MGEDPVASLNGIRKRDTSHNRRPAESIPDAVLGGHETDHAISGILLPRSPAGFERDTRLNE
jgi:hypothetical protein